MRAGAAAVGGDGGDDGDGAAACESARVVASRVDSVAAQMHGYSVRDVKSFVTVVLSSCAFSASVGAPCSVSAIAVDPTATRLARIADALAAFPVPRIPPPASRARSLAVNRDNIRRVTWDDIAGLASVKQAIHRSIIWPIRNPAKARRFGMDRLGGVLLHGPPGCAKTTLARAICSEGGFGAFFHLDCASVMSAFVGEAERCVRDVFAQARAQAPAVIFFDEIEAFGVKRKGGGGGGGGGGSGDVSVRLLATLLTEMDGIHADASASSSSSWSTRGASAVGAEGNADDDDAAIVGASDFGVCVVGATKLLPLVDDALLRPGRFELLLEVPLPNGDDRERILRHCEARSNSSNNNTPGSGGNDAAAAASTTTKMTLTANISLLAAISQGCSGADITGAWRDGVVAFVMSLHRQGGDVGGGGAAGTEPGSLGCGVEVPAGPADITEHVARSLRGMRRL